MRIASTMTLLTLALAGCASGDEEPAQPASSAQATNRDDGMKPAPAPIPKTQPKRSAEPRPDTAQAAAQAGGPAPAIKPRAWPGEAPPEGAEVKTTPSGLRWVVLHTGQGKRPSPTSMVKVHYTGWRAIDGQMFDSSVRRGQPSTFRLDRVIAGWTEGVGNMRPGAKHKLIIPAALAYGDAGRPPTIPPKADLIFDVELLEVIAPLQSPTFAWPPDAELTTTGSGLAYLVLEEGEGDHPSATDTVTVHYAGWLPDGTEFDASYTRGQPASFPLNRVIPGWTEGLQLMRPGGVWRFVIPPDLAYGARGAPPHIGPDATLLFHVQLLKIGSLSR